MNYARHRFTPAPARNLDRTGDQIARALAKFTKSPQQLENDKRLFRFRAKRDMRNLIGSIRDERDLLNRLHCVWIEYLSEPPVSIDQAIARLERHYAAAKDIGADQAHGNNFMALKSRLLLARLFRRYRHLIWEFGS